MSKLVLKMNLLNGDTADMTYTVEDFSTKEEFESARLVLATEVADQISRSAVVTMTKNGEVLGYLNFGMICTYEIVPGE